MPRRREVDKRVVQPDPKFQDRVVTKFINNIMFALPGETLDHAIKSISFNTEIKPFGARACILKLYKGTELVNIAKNLDLCEGVGEFTYKAKDSRNEHAIMENMIWAAVLFVRFPFLLRWARPILKSKVLRLLNKPLMMYIHWQDIVFLKIPIWQALQYFYSSRDVFLKGTAGAQDDVYENLPEPVKAAEKETPKLVASA